MHFFFLSSFCWVLTEAWQSYMAVTGRLRNRIIRKRFLCLGWGEDRGSHRGEKKKKKHFPILGCRAERVQASRRADALQKAWHKGLDTSGSVQKGWDG